MQPESDSLGLVAIANATEALEVWPDQTAPELRAISKIRQPSAIVYA